MYVIKYTLKTIIKKWVGQIVLFPLQPGLKILKSTDASEEIQNAKWDAMMQLQKLPANSSKVRKHNRCGLTGRPRGYMRQFGISRVTFREMALSGKIPGVKKASW